MLRVQLCIIICKLQTCTCSFCIVIGLIATPPMPIDLQYNTMHAWMYNCIICNVYSQLTMYCYTCTNQSIWIPRPEIWAILHGHFPKNGPNSGKLYACHACVYVPLNKDTRNQDKQNIVYWSQLQYMHVPLYIIGFIIASFSPATHAVSAVILQI